jgi:uncharacterized membrane protein
MGLKTSEVYRCLEKKTLVFGFEIIDVFLVFSVLAILSFLLRGVPYKFFLSWGPALSLALFLRMGKAGKPENYLLHLARSYFSPVVWSAFPLAPRRSKFVSPKQKGSV